MMSSTVPLEALELRLLMAVIPVTSNADGGAGSLRAALSAAVDGDTIDLTDRSGVITLTSGELAVTKNVSILGSGSDELTISGNANSRVFNTQSGRIVGISDLTIIEGNAHSGGGISNNGTLTLDRVVISNCAAEVEGGAIDSNGILVMNDCSILGNTSQGVGGGINSWSPLTMNRCTIADNSAHAPAGTDPELGDFAGFGRGGGLARWQGVTVPNRFLRERNYA